MTHQSLKFPCTGLNATRLAARLLSNVAQGRGATLPLDVVSLGMTCITI